MVLKVTILAKYLNIADIVLKKSQKYCLNAQKSRNIFSD